VSAAVIVSFFSPVGYKLPQRHFHAVVNTLHAQGIPLVVTQAVMPGQEPQPVPAAIPQATFPITSTLWLKENLWNLAAGMTDAEALVFVDADIVFSTTAWLSRTLAALDAADIVQPFAEARWLDERGVVEMTKRPATDALSRPDVPKMDRYHPGFAWAMTRDAHQRLGGLHDRNVCGGNDAALFFALSSHPEAHRYIEHWGKRQDRTVFAPSWQAYRENAQGQRFRFATVQGVTVTHLWHGSRTNRNYHTRESGFRRNAIGEYDVLRRADGILEWLDPSDAKAAADYFTSRREDG
jgi:hypothetical protein